jgi:hypothetical protein
MRIDELTGDLKYPWRFVGRKNQKFVYEFETADQLPYRVFFLPETLGPEDQDESIDMYSVDFAQVADLNPQYKITGTGDALAVFGTVIDVIQDFVKRVNVDVLAFMAVNEPSRIRLYASAAPRLAQQLGRHLLTAHDQDSIAIYLIKRDPKLIDAVKSNVSPDD